MTPTEIVTICISTIALVVSIVSVAMQYGRRDNTQFKVTKIELTSLKPENEIDRTFAIVLNISIFNMGNRPISLESLSLSLDGEVNAASKDDGRTPISREGNGLIILPISQETYSNLTFSPVVVAPNTIYSQEIVFDLFHFEEGHEFLTAEGSLKLKGTFYNSKGQSSEIDVSIAKIDISAVRNEKSSYSIDFQYSESELNKVKF